MLLAEAKPTEEISSTFESLPLFSEQQKKAVVELLQQGERISAIEYAKEQLNLSACEAQSYVEKELESPITRKQYASSLQTRMKACAEATFTVAHELQAQHKYRQAIYWFKRSIEANASLYSSATWNIGLCLTEMGQLKEAAAIFETFTQAHIGERHCPVSKQALWMQLHKIYKKLAWHSSANYAAQQLMWIH